MNEQLQQKLLQYLNGLESLADKSGDFLGDQIPQIAIEIVKFGAASHIIWAVINMAVVICIEIIRRRITSAFASNKKSYDLTDITIANVLSIVPIIMFFLFSAIELVEAMKAIVAPRLFLLEYVKTLIK